MLKLHIPASRFKPLAAILLALLMLFGALPLELMASQTVQATITPEPFMLSPYVYRDGEPFYVGARPVTQPRQRSSTLPPVSDVVSIPGTFNRTPSVTMNGTTVSAQRYVARLNGQDIEAFCANPTQRGPENSAAAYDIVSEASQIFMNALRYGFSSNPLISDRSVIPDDNDLMYWAYVTRVAVAMAQNTNANFAGNDADTMNTARSLNNGDSFFTGSDFENTHPAIALNGDRHAEDLNRVATGLAAQSTTFQVSYYRRFNDPTNRFYFEWSAGTPVGARLVVDGEVVATAPTNPTTHFGGSSNPTPSFHIEMDNIPANQGQEAKVYLVGVNNQWANRVWLMQNTVNPSEWQDIVFYIPYIRSSAVFSFDYPTVEDAALRIRKLSSATNQGLAAATFTITGPGGFSRTVTTGANGEHLITGLEPGEYTLTEIQPPLGYQLSNPTTQTITIEAGSTEAVTVTFTNDPDTSTTIPGPDPEPEPEIPTVRIQKICAITRQNVPGALMRLQGMSSHQVVTGDGQLWEIDNTGINASQVLTSGATTAMGDSVTSTVIDGVWTIEGLPWGFYMVSEERAPDGFSLYPQHTAFGFWVLPPNVLINSPDGVTYNIVEQGPNPNHILITFENYPFSEVVVYKREVSNGVGNNQLLAGATFRIQGYYPGNPAIPIDRVATTGTDGRVVFSNLPAGHFTITEIQPPTGYLLGENNVWSVNVGWGQTVAAGTAPSHTFFNIPKSSLEILKIDGITNEPLSGAIFELYDPTTGEAWQATTGTNGIATIGRGSYGNFLYPYRTYILREIVAPEGYVLMDGPREIVLSPGNENRITWRNWQNPGLTIIKLCQDTNERLEGAHFTITAQGSGRPLPTDFPLITNEDGEIFIPWTLFEGEHERNFIVTETVAPPGFLLSNPNWQLVTMQAGYPNTVIFANRRKPTLTIQKIDSRTNYPVQGAWFEVEFLGATQGTGSGNIGPSGPLTNNPFITDNLGRIVIDGLYPGRYRIREIRPANNYWLDPLEQNRTWIIDMRENEDYILTVENTLLPTLVITKRNAVTWRPIPMTQFRVDFEQPNSPNVQHIGYFMTNSQGQIILPFVQVGWYRITETRPAPGMTLASNNNFRIFLQPGDNSYTLIREGIIRSESMISPAILPPPTGNEPAVEGDEGYTEDITATTPNAPTPDIPQDTEIEAIEPDTDAIIDSNLAPEESEPILHAPPFLPDSDIDLENINITHVENPDLVARLTSQLQVWGGDYFWNNSQDVWNFPTSSLVIRKENARTGQLLEGATFTVTQISSGNDSGLAGTIIGQFTTNHSGIIVIAGLEPGFYVVEEVVPPTNFTLSLNNRQHAFIRPDDTSVVEMTFSNHPYASLVISKRCEVTGIPLQNAQFRVVDSTGAVVGTANGLFTTNAQGEILIPNLPPGSYVVTETRAPSGFILNSTPQTINIGATGNAYRLEFTNRPEGVLIIRKLDSYDNTPLANATFEVRHQNGQYVGTFVTGPSGSIEIPGLLGWFIVEETIAPPGFALDENALRTVEVRPGEPTVVTFRNPREGSLTIIKEDNNGNPLAGARFRVSRQNGERVGEFTSPASGMINIPNLTAGLYFVEEIQAPTGFIMAQGGQTVEVRPNSSAQVTFINYRRPSLVIEKVDTEGNPLQGAEFEVRTLGGELISRATTNQGGMATLNNLNPGSISVTEVRAPQGFVLDSTAQTAELTPGETTTLRFVNRRQPSLIIEKVDTEGNPLANAEFEIRTLGGNLVQRITSNTGGIATVESLPPGSYTVTETRAPQGFILDSNAQAIEIRAGETITIRFVNTRYSETSIRKISGDDGRPLQGVIFEVTRLNGERITNPANRSFEFVTDASGMIHLPHLPAGTYVATETRALPGYSPAEPVTFEVVNGQNTVITVRNYKRPSVVIRKICGETNTPLEGVQFEIVRYFSNGQTGQRLKNYAVDGSYTFTTDRSGHIYLPAMEDGAWMAIETRPLPGFMAGEPTLFTVGINGDTTIIVRNYRYPDFAISKICGNTNRPLQGVEFEIAHYLGGGRAGERLRNPANGTTTFVTDAAGLIQLPGIAPGMYVAIETRALPGYVIEGPVTFEVRAGDSGAITIRNYKQPSVVIRKICGETERPLQNVQFEFVRYFGNGSTGQRLKNYAVDGSYTFATDSSGHIYLQSMEDGVWMAIETRPLPGFMAADPTIFTVGNNGDMTVIVRNYPYPDFALLKLDGDTLQPLQGVHFEIAHDLGNGQAGQRLVNPADGTTTFITDNAGRIPLPSIAPGRYIAIETRALPGYTIEGPTLFTVEAGQNRTITIYNFKRGDWVIRKRCGDTNQPLEGVQFEIARYFGNGNAGERLRNPVDGSNTFTTDNAGLIQLPNLEAGTYIAIETRALPGFIVGGRIPGTEEWVISNDTTATIIFNPAQPPNIDRIPQSGW